MRIGLLKYFMVIFGIMLLNEMSGQCPDFDGLIRKGDAYLTQKSPNYQEAINAYIAAIINCTHRASEAQQRISKMVNGINELRAKAVISETKAKEALEAVKKAEEKAIIERNNAITSEQKSSKILSNIKFTDNRAWVFQDGKFAIIDSLGNRYCDFVYTQPRQFDERGFTIATFNDNEVLLDKSGNIVFSQKTIHRTTNGYYLCNKGTQYFFLSSSGKVVSDTFLVIRPFNEGRAWIYDKEKWKILTNEFNTIVPDIDVIVEPKPFFQGLSESPEWSKILFSRDGSVFADSIIDYKFINDTIVQLSKEDHQVAWKNINGKFEVPFIKGWAIDTISNKLGINLTEIKGYLSVYDLSKQKVIKKDNTKTIIDWCDNIYFDNQYFSVETSKGKFGVYDLDGMEIISPTKGLSEPIEMIKFPYAYTYRYESEKRKPLAIINLETKQILDFSDKQHKETQFIGEIANLMLIIEDKKRDTVEIFDIQKSKTVFQFGYYKDIDYYYVPDLDSISIVVGYEPNTDKFKYEFCRNGQILPYKFSIFFHDEKINLSSKMFFGKISNKWHSIDLTKTPEKAVVDTFIQKPHYEFFFYVGELKNGFKLFFENPKKVLNNTVVVYHAEQYYIDRPKKQVLLFDSNKCFLVDEKGQVIKNYDIGESISFDDSLSIIKQNGRSKIINRKNQKLSERSFDYIEKTNGDKFITFDNEKWGLVDEEGNYLLNNQYDSIKVEGKFVKIQEKGKWGAYAISENKVLFETKYDSIHIYQEDTMHHNIVIVGNIGGKSEVLDGYGTALFESKNLIIGGDNTIGLIEKTIENKFYLFDKNHTKILENDYCHISLFSQNNMNYAIFKVCRDTVFKYGCINLTTHLLIADTIYDDIFHLDRRGFLVVRKGEKTGTISIFDGTVLIEPSLKNVRYGFESMEECNGLKYYEIHFGEDYQQIMIDSLGKAISRAFKIHDEKDCKNGIHILSNAVSNLMWSFAIDNSGKDVISPKESLSIEWQGDLLKRKYSDDSYQLFYQNGEKVFPYTIYNEVYSNITKDSVWFINSDTLMFVDIKNKTYKLLGYYPYRVECTLSPELSIVEDKKEGSLYIFNLKTLEVNRDFQYCHIRDKKLGKLNEVIEVELSCAGEHSKIIIDSKGKIKEIDGNKYLQKSSGYNSNGEFIID